MLKEQCVKFPSGSSEISWFLNEDSGPMMMMMMNMMTMMNMMMIYFQDGCRKIDFVLVYEELRGTDSSTVDQVFSKDFQNGGSSSGGGANQHGGAGDNNIPKWVEKSAK